MGALRRESHPSLPSFEESEQVFELFNILLADRSLVGDEKQDFLLPVWKNDHILRDPAREIEVPEGDPEVRIRGGAFQRLQDIDLGVLQASIVHHDERDKIGPSDELE